jgi:two-component system, cell cycle sensor histidine kinase and response regulator CckA
MKKTFRLLHLEDDPLDAELIQHQLIAGGLSLDITWAQDKDSFEAALINQEYYDLFLCDYNLPGYDGLSALKQTQSKHPEAPVIILSGTLGEEQAVECLKMGATDFVLKQHSSRLLPSVLRALAESEEHRQRKQAEEALESERRLLCSLIENSPDYIYFKDLHGRFLQINEAHANLFRLNDPCEAFNKTDFDFFEESDARLFQEDEERIISTGESIIGREDSSHLLDGRLVWISTTKMPLRSNNGQIIGIMGISRDISERKRSEAEKERLSVAIEQSPEAVVITDLDGAIQYVNPAFVTISGYTFNEALGKNLKTGEHPPSFYDEMWTTISSGNVWTGHIVNKRKDGSIYTEEASIAPVKDSSGTITNYVAVKRDITQELIKEEELRHAQKMEAIGQLAGGIAHDFNNILQGILGFSQLLECSLEAGTEEFDNAIEIKKAAKRAAELIRQLLTFSRKQPVQLTPININNVIHDAEVLLNVLLGEGFKTVLDLADELPLVNSDPGQLSQIVMNLTVNARDAMPEGGRLTIKTHAVTFSEQDVALLRDGRPGSFVCLSITDSGTGMEEEVKERLFEPFFTTKAVGRGTGLGLSVVYGIVKQNKGWINVYSEIGKGTCLKIYFPVHDNPAPTPPNNQATDHNDKPKPNPRMHSRDKP